MNKSFYVFRRHFALITATLAFLASASATPLLAATITVTSSADAGGTCPGPSCSLRQAIATAASGDTIFFDIPTFADGYNAATQVFAITLTSGELAIGKNLTIDGGASKIVVARNILGGAPKFHIFHITAGTVNISNLTITNGFGSPGDVDGGAIHNGGNLTVRNCTISGNAAGPNGSGAGIYIEDQASLAVINSTIHGNTISFGEGAGIGMAQNAMVDISDCTITNNTLPGGGNAAGVIARGTTHIRNTIIAGNQTGNGASGLVPFDVEGTFISGGFNFIGSQDTSTGFANPGSHDQVGTSASPIDPKLGPLRDNGGTTKTKAPLSGSTLIDQGSSGGLTTDQRGDPRPVHRTTAANGPGDFSDIGAVEVGLSQFPQSGATEIVTNTDEHNEHECRVDDCTLAAAIEDGDFIAANASLGPVTIKFAPGLGGVILNTTVPTGLSISAALNIVGPGARVLTISGNNVARVFNVTGGTGNIVNISGLTIANANSGSGVSGGGISNSANLHLLDCAVVNNSGGSGGGAVNSGTFHVTNCTFADNQSTGHGGALRNVGDLVVTNSTFNNNTAVSSGAITSFVNNGQPAATLNVTNCTISGNTASDTSGGTGGGIFNGNLSTATVSNTIVANNTAATGTDVSGPFTSGGHNLIRIAMGSTGFTNGNNGDQAGIPAGLDTLQNNGGPTDTMALLSDSTARDNGNDTNAPKTDQRGAARMGVSDIGAFEFNGIPPAPPTVTTNAATNVGTTSATLNATVNPNGLPTSFRFTSDFAFFATQDAGSGTSSVPFSVNVTGLAPNTTYHFNAVAMSNGVTTNGVEQTFTTPSLPTPTPTPIPNSTTLANISTRLRVETGDNALIGGFIVTGTQPKKVMIRAIGPSLPFADKLADPTLELRDSSGALLDSNDNWQDSPNKQAIIDSTIAPSDPLESAILATLPANGSGYTAIVRGVSNGTGIGVVEAYDLDTSANSKLANISTRGLVQTGDNVLIAGTIVIGQAPQKVIVEALGPSLTVPGKLEDPTLELRDANGTVLDANDNWVDSPNKQAIIDSTIPPGNDFESAIIAILPAGGAQYTAIVRGVNGTTGVAVVEVFALN
jgi:Right handed beta helix region